MEFPVSLTSLILVILLVVPGVVLKRCYFQGQFTKEFNFGIFADRFISSIFLGIIVQIISFLVLGKIYGFSYESIKDPLTKLYKGLSDSNFKIISSNDLWMALGYLATSLTVAVFLGWGSHKIVRVFRLDTTFPLFRFNNQWNYFFRGDIVHAKEFRSIKKGKVIETYIDVVIDSDHDGRKKMVSGFLSDYSISSRTGDLETLYITEAKRFSGSKNCHVDVEGDCFIVPFNKVLDMNLKYVFKQVDVSKRKQILDSAYELVTMLLFITICTIPWFIETDSYIMKFLIFSLSFLDYVLFMVITGSVINPDKSNALKGKSLSITIVFFAILLALILQFANVW